MDKGRLDKFGKMFALMEKLVEIGELSGGMVEKVKESVEQGMEPQFEVKWENGALVKKIGLYQNLAVE